jgi:preprotein translocase subunit SecY
LGFRLSTILTLTTGTMFVMWLGEQITERGIGNGIFVIDFRGYRDRSAAWRAAGAERLSGGDTMATLGVIAMLIALILIIAFIVFVEAARRKIPVSYAKRHVGRQVVGGQQTTMPLKINMGGVIPVIFASSVLSMPQSLFAAFPPDPD